MGGFAANDAAQGDKAVILNTAIMFASDQRHGQRRRDFQNAGNGNAIIINPGRLDCSNRPGHQFVGNIFIKARFYDENFGAFVSHRIQSYRVSSSLAA